MAPRARTVVLAALCLLACGEDPTGAVPDIPGKDGVGKAVEVAMADGVATLAEYRAGVERFVACLDAAGHEVEDLRFVDASQLYDYRIPGAAVASGAEQACYEQELRPIDESWQDSLVRPRGPGELRGLAPMLARCLDLHGIPYEGVVTERSDPAALEAIALDNGLTLYECVSEVAATLDQPSGL